MRGFLGRTVLALIAVVLTTQPLIAQQGTVTGRVLTEEGGIVPGASVLVMGTQREVLANQNGTYALPAPVGVQRIQARAFGYRTAVQEVTVADGESVTLDFTLEVSRFALDEVVVSVSAGDVTRREVGTDIASIDVASQIDDAAVTDFSSLLNGRAGNVTVTQASGNVGAGSRIRVRGVNSLTQDNNPLLIIDGVRANNNTAVGINRGQTFSRFNDLNPADIENIQVVKGPAATALYGSEAASGVIVVTTKKGGAGQNQFTFSVETGYMEDVTAYPDNYADVTPFGITDPNDPRLAPWRTSSNPTTGQVFVLDNPFEDASTSPFRTGQFSTYNLSLAGGQDSFSYYTSLRFEDREGVLPSNDVNRLSFRGNFQALPREDLQVNVSAGYTRSEVNLPKSGGNTSGYFTNALAGIPLSAKGSDGSCLAALLGAADESFCDKDGNTRAGFDKIEPIISRENVDRFTSSFQLRSTPRSWLTATAKLGADVTDQLFTDAIPFDPDVPFSFAAGGENFLSRPLTRIITADLGTEASYGVTESVRGATSVGAQYFNTRIETIACEGRVFPNDQATACDAAVSLRGFSDLSENVEIGAYFQQRLSYGGYLFMTGALRVDDNSSLGEDEGAIWSPSFNTSFVISDLPSWNVDAFSDLRLRFAWGTASQSPSQYAADRTYVISRLAQGGNVVAGLSPLDPGNPNLGPERNEEFEIGLNAGLLDDRLGVSLTYFSRTTTDAIVSRPVAPSSGFANDRFINIGELENSGLEATLDAVLLERDNFSWDATLQYSSVDPRVARLGTDNPIFVGAGQILADGAVPGSYYSRVITSAERDASGEIIPGSIQYAPGNIQEGSDLRIVGQPIPTNEQSLSTAVTLFESLRISTLFDRKAGHQALNGTRDGRNPGSLSGANSRFAEEWAFRQTQSTAVEQAMLEADEFLGDHNAIFVEDADFIKWREIRATYSLPASFASQFRASGASLYAGGRNLAVWTDFRGLDPEANEYGARDSLRSEVDNALPPPRLFFFGLTFSF